MNQSTFQLLGNVASADFYLCEGSDITLISNNNAGTIPCQVDTYKNENTIFLIRPNRGNIPPRFGHFF